MDEDMDNIIKYVKNRISELEYEYRAILDLSMYPELNNIIKTQRLDFTPIYYFPDTIAKLFLKAKENEQYYYFISRLFAKWTQRPVDFRLLNKIFKEKRLNQIKIELITDELIDREVYSFCYKTFISKDLLVELSPQFNLVGDIIGKILGFAKKSKTPILMLNRKLIRFVREEIPIFDAANMFVDKKQEFFSRFIPLRRTRGIRWFVGITVGTSVPPIGFVLAVMDP